MHPMIHPLGDLLELLKNTDRYLGKLQPRTPQSPPAQGSYQLMSKSVAEFGSSCRHPIHSILTLQLMERVI